MVVDVRWLVVAAVLVGVFWLAKRRPDWIQPMTLALAAAVAAYAWLYTPFGE
ncbi:hypothetical protein [Cryptosporangium sp. NPDC051539]|uniref:hypothetical protein n=1 Tax=Cryptosporangium sp. NPDC051539 TaxID=3363962 RepID=UPI0037AEBCB1